MKVIIYVERNDEEIEVEVEGDINPGCKERWYLDNGDPGYPGESPSAEITSAIDTNTGMEITLTTDEEEIAEDELLQAWEGEGFGDE